MKSPLRNSLAACAAALAFVLLAALAQAAGAQEGKTDTEQLLQVELGKFWVDENGWTQLHWAAAADDGEAIRRLADMGAPMNPVDNEYDEDNKFSDKGKRRAQLLGVKNIYTNVNTPLHVASRFNKSVAASVLIANGAEVNAKTKDGWTPLHGAAEGNAAEAAELLIEGGADVNVKKEGGYTPLHWAAAKNAAEVAKLLIGNGADVNAKDGLDFTPLHWAADENAADVVKLLLDNGAEVNAQGGFGSPLHGAAGNNAADAAKLLIEKGAEVNAKNDEGYTPMDWAINAGHSAMRSFLRRHGGRCNKKC